MTSFRANLRGLPLARRLNAVITHQREGAGQFSFGGSSISALKADRLLAALCLTAGYSGTVVILIRGSCARRMEIQIVRWMAQPLQVGGKPVAACMPSRTVLPTLAQSRSSSEIEHPM